MNEADEKLVKRINELYHLSKQRKLTELEIKEQKKLRLQFLANFRAGFKQQIEDIVFVDEKGNEVTSEKDKAVQRKKGLRKD